MNRAYDDPKFDAFIAPDEMSVDEVRARCAILREAGARSFQMTEVSDRYPNPPYPNGFYLQGWAELHPNFLPFGEADSRGVVCPPLMEVDGNG